MPKCSHPPSKLRTLYAALGAGADAVTPGAYECGACYALARAGLVLVPQETARLILRCMGVV